MSDYLGLARVYGWGYIKRRRHLRLSHVVVNRATFHGQNHIYMLFMLPSVNGTDSVIEKLRDRFRLPSYKMAVMCTLYSQDPKASLS